MSQTITVNIKIIPTAEQAEVLTKMSSEYINVINSLVNEMVHEKRCTRKTTKDVKAYLPSAVKNQAIQDAKSIFKRVKKNKYKQVPVLKKHYCMWNNNNYSFENNYILLPLMSLIGLDVARKIPIRAKLIVKGNRTLELLKHKLGTLRIIKKSNKWIAQVSVTIPTTEKDGTKVMGVDLGLKVPAVAVTEDGKTRFFGNGRKNKYIRRKYKTLRKQLGKNKNLKLVKKIGNKEKRYMDDQDHKISRSIVNFANENNVSVIRLENLKGIRQTARKSRKNEMNLYEWSFYRLTKYIVYKANLAGIKVEYVDPAFTSKKCPKCSENNKAKDRKYECKCGFVNHRDIVGAMNIRYAPVIDGDSQSA